MQTKETTFQKLRKYMIKGAEEIKNDKESLSSNNLEFIIIEGPNDSGKSRGLVGILNSGAAGNKKLSIYDTHGTFQKLTGSFSNYNFPTKIDNPSFHTSDIKNKLNSDLLANKTIIIEDIYAIVPTGTSMNEVFTKNHSRSKIIITAIEAEEILRNYAFIKDYKYEILNVLDIPESIY